MLVQLPRLTSSLREPFDVDQAYLQRKLILQNQSKPRQSSSSVDESELARKIVHGWEEASYELRQAYKQFIGAVVELIDGEVQSEEFREVALAVYRLFGRPEEEGSVETNFAAKKQQVQMLLGHTVSDANMRKVASLAQELSGMQSSDHWITLVSETPVNGTHENVEFGADLVFHPPARFLVDLSLDDGGSLCEEMAGPSTYYEGSYDRSGFSGLHSATDGRSINLSWLQDVCDQITKCSTQLSRDELAMAICRVLDSDKAGDEIAGDLLDLVGDSAFEIVQDLLSHRKELVDAIHHGLLVMKSDKSSLTSQPRMPSYGTQVTVQTESERQIDKLRRKEEKRNRRGTEYGTDSDLAGVSFSSLLEASERKNLFDDLKGLGEGIAVNALPQGTQRKHHKGYEEVLIPPTPGAQMKPGEKLVCAPTGAGKTNIAMISILHEVIYIAHLKAIVRERMNDWRKRLVSQLGKKMVEMTGDYTPDLMAILSADIIISTPEKWDGISRNWHSRTYVKKVGLMILDEIHLLGADCGPILEVIVSRMRYISSQKEREVRFVGLSTALANAGDLADWLGVGETELFNFKPIVRPVPLEVHVQISRSGS